ncbi:MAG: pyridoxal-phosphate dependent enzyme, partial [Candidatus Aminicenantes bacterium]|nr:pyridoxal-phosphate dependent enzyme [Candidatus Aminicenantes bacterium]
IRGILKGFEEFRLCELINKVPKMICAQAAGCSPIYNAFSSNKETISRVETPHTIARAIANPYPPSGNEVLRKIRENRGIIVAVTDEEILRAQRRLAGEAIFGQPASAVPLAAVDKLRKEHMLTKNDTVVCIVTGSGLKSTAILKEHNLKVLHSRLEDLDRLIENQL